jgi:ribosomal protein L11 methyltransferase
MSEFLELTVGSKEPLAENAEIITAFLSEYPFDVFEHDGSMVKAFGAAINFQDSDFEEIKQLIGEYMVGDIQTRFIPKENWNELWETHYFEPVSIDGRVRLRATFQPPNPEMEYDLVIQPKMSFGTGHHSTTQLMMSLMLGFEESFHSARVLDMGAGTGILAVLAEKLGAEKADAIDIEDWAAENIDENASLNQCKNIHSHHGDAALLQKFDVTYDIILANIHKQVLLTEANVYLSKLKTEGLIFLSGFYAEDLADIQTQYEKLDCTLIEHKLLNNWCAAVFSKN